VNASEWIKKFNEAQTDEEILRLWAELSNQSPRTSSGGWDHENDEVTREVHKAVGMKVTRAHNRFFRIRPWPKVIVK